MKTMRTNMQQLTGTPDRQRGIGVLALLYVLITMGLIGLVVVKSLPVYLNAYDIRQTVQWAASQPKLVRASAPEIQSAIQRRFDAGYVDNIGGRDFAVSKVDGGRQISVEYEVRRPLLFNLSLVYSFEESALLTGNDAS